MTTNSYDAVGNMLTTEDPNGVTTTNTFTPLDQLASVSYSGSAAHSVSYVFDANGNRTSMVDGSGTSTYSYDVFDEPTSIENGAAKTVSYRHDSLGDTTGITYPLGTESWSSTDTVSYGYDAASELSSVTDFNTNTTTETNTADGLPSSVSLGLSGDTLNTSYDPTDSPSSITLTNGTTLQEFAYSDVPSSAIAAETDTPTSAVAPADYTYDAQSRVTQMVPGTSSTLSYGYDASDNPTTLPTGATGTYDDSSELTSSVKSATTSTYTYDADGERTAFSGGSTVSASYNGAEQLTSYSNAAADTTSATYDGDGVRSAATTTPSGGGSSTQNFTWNATASVPQLLMDSTNAYLYGPTGTPFEQVNLSTGTIKYLDADALGSVRGIVSSSGSLSSSTSYDAYGNPETTGGLSSSTPFGFAGGYTDPTGLSYLIHRYYDPSTGQFLSVDPLVDQTGQAYSYAGGDPVDSTDPMGLCSTSGGTYLVPGACHWTSMSWVTQTENTIQGEKGGGFSFSNGFKAVADYGAGIANFAVSTATLGNAHVSAPYCGFGWASDVGYWYGAGATALLGGAEAEAADAEEEIPSVIYREGTPRPGNLTPRPVDNGALSFRDSLSNPIGSSSRPVLRPGQPYIGIDTSQLPPGSVVLDGVPPGHVSVVGVSAEELRQAVIERGTFPK